MYNSLSFFVLTTYFLHAIMYCTNRKVLRTQYNVILEEIMKRRIVFALLAALFILSSAFFASCADKVEPGTTAPKADTTAPVSEETTAPANEETETTAPKPYDVTINVTPAEGGKVTGDGTYPKGTNVTITAEANSGYTFGGWYQDTTLISSDASFTFELKYHSEYTARFISDSPSAAMVLYVKTEGTGDGTTPEAPLGSLEAALEAIGAFSDGTIVIMGDYTYAAQVEAPQSIGALTITGKYNGVDYQGNILNTSTGHYICGGDTTFTDIKLTLTSTMVIRARFHKLTFTDSFVSASSTGAPVPSLYVVGGDQGSQSHYNNIASGDTNVVINGGTFLEVIAGGRSGSPENYSGTLNLTLDNCEVNKVCTAGRALNGISFNDANITVGNAKINYWISQGDFTTSGITGKLVITFLSTFDIDKSFNGAPNGERTTTDTNQNVIFNGICGASAFYSYTIDDGGNRVPGGTYKEQMALAQSIICKIDASIYDKVTQSDKFLADSFTSVEKN